MEISKHIQDRIRAEAAKVCNPVEDSEIYMAFEMGATHYAYHIIKFTKWKDENCIDAGEWTVGPLGRVYSTEELLDYYFENVK